MNLSIHVPFQLHGEHTSIDPAIVTVLRILLCTLPSLSYWVLIHLCEVKQVRVKCLVQVYNIEATLN